MRLVEGLCEESGGKELCLELVDIYQVAYLLFLPCLAHAYIHLFLHLLWRFFVLIHTISLVGVCNPTPFSKRKRDDSTIHGKVSPIGKYASHRCHLAPLQGVYESDLPLRKS